MKEKIKGLKADLKEATTQLHINQKAIEHTQCRRAKVLESLSRFFTQNSMVLKKLKLNCCNGSCTSPSVKSLLCSNDVKNFSIPRYLTPSSLFQPSSPFLKDYGTDDPMLLDLGFMQESKAPSSPSSSPPSSPTNTHMSDLPNNTPPLLEHLVVYLEPQEDNRPFSSSSSSRSSSVLIPR